MAIYDLYSKRHPSPARRKGPLGGLVDSVRRLVLAARGESAVSKPSEGRLVYPMKADSEREYVSVGLTPAKLVALMKDFDAGDLVKGLELAAQMEEKDLHLASVANTRRLALTGLPWEIVSAADVHEIEDSGLKNAADEAAAFCRERLSRIAGKSRLETKERTGLEASLRHLALAMGRNISVAEIVWGPEGLEDIVPVPHTRLTYKLDGEEPELRVLTAEAAQDGVPMDAAKWMVHKPHALAGLPMWGGLLRASAAAYVAKAFAAKDWLVFVELFGMPVRIAKYDPSATSKDKQELLAMLRSLGSDAAGIFSKAVELELKETGKQGESPYERVCAFFNAELSKAWLGQTLTTEVGDSGSRALGDVHNEVRQDLLADDIRAEGVTVREDLLAPMVMFELGPDAPVPYFRRRVDETRDPLQLCDVVERAVRMGARVSRTWFESEIGVQTTEEDEDVLVAASPASPFGGLGLKDHRLKTGATQGHGSQLRAYSSQLILSDSDQAAADEYVEQLLPEVAAIHELIIEAVDEWLAAQSGSVDEMLAALLESTEVGEITGQLAGLIEQLLIASNLQGRLRADAAMGRRGEGAMSRMNLAQSSQPTADGTLVLAEPVFLNVPFEEAIAALRNRLNLTRESFDELSREAKSRAFTAAWVDNLRIMSKIHDAAVTALAEGQTLRDFRLNLPEMAEQQGWIGERAWHAELVLRQQSMMATQAGRFDQMQDAGVTHWRYSALGDGRTRPEHAALDGKVFALDDRAFYPPWDFNCRCVAEPVFASELDGAEIERSSDLAGRQIGSNPETGEPIRLQPARQFEWDPAYFAGRQSVDLSTVPPRLRSAFEKLQGQQPARTENPPAQSLEGPVASGTNIRGPNYLQTATDSPHVKVNQHGQIKLTQPKTAAEAERMLQRVMEIHDRAQAQARAAEGLPFDHPQRVQANLRAAHAQAQLERAMRMARKVK